MNTQSFDDDQLQSQNYKNFLCKLHKINPNLEIVNIMSQHTVLESKIIYKFDYCGRPIFDLKHNKWLDNSLLSEEENRAIERIVKEKAKNENN